MTTHSDQQNDRATTPAPTGPATAELHTLLAGFLCHLDEGTSEAVLQAIRTELDARDARAYAGGWQDALTSGSLRAGR